MGGKYIKFCRATLIQAGMLGTISGGSRPRGLSKGFVALSIEPEASTLENQSHMEGFLTLTCLVKLNRALNYMVVSQGVVRKSCGGTSGPLRGHFAVFETALFQIW